MNRDTSPSTDPRFSDRLDRYLAAPKRAVWTMAAPMMAGMAVHTLYIIADTAFIGTLGTEALAAATFVGPVFFMMVAMTMGLSTAVTALVAQAVGRRDTDGADRVAGTAMSFGIALGCAMAIAGLWSGPAVLVHLGASGLNAAYAWQYFQIISLTVPLFFISSVFRSVLTGEGDARTPMLVLFGSTVLNIALDAIFILGLDLGLRGAALATAASVLASLTTFGLIILRRRTAYVRFRVENLKLSRPVLGRIVALAAPTAAGMAVMSAGGLLFNRLLAGFGEIAVAAYGAASKVDMIVALPIMGLAGAAVSVVGMFAGAGRVDLVRSTAVYTYRWAVLLASLIGITAYLGSNPILRLFTEDQQAIAIGHTYLAFMLFAYPMMAFGMTSGRLLQGIGHGVPSLVITSIRVLIVAVPLAYTLVLLFEAPLEAVWASSLVGGLCSTVLASWWVRRLVWNADPTVRATRR
ncbi:MAG: MATE family efflux transporter [Thermoanaerobaculales bacterium]|jgi:putative MATE family efflux protein|nr:MATE family efflux transporter [Thermoanaerobaculales bacterium]